MKQTLLLLLVAWLPITASAYYAKIGKIYYDFNYSEKTATVTYKEKGDDVGTFINDCSGDVDIPSEVTYNGDTYSVTSIGHGAFYGCKGITSVTIPNSVKTIVSYAFMGCDGITSITIPASVTSIGYLAFKGCSKLSSLIIGKSVISIDASAFSTCSGLTSIVVESDNTVYDSRDNCNAIIKTKENEMILGCINTTIPNSVTSLVGAFHDVYNLTSITIPNSVRHIEDFGGCNGLTSIDIPNSVTSIGPGAFWGCNGLTSVDIPNSVTTIGGSAFEYCNGLTSVDIPNSVTTIGGSAFAYCSKLESVNLPENLAYLGKNAFEDTPWYNSWYNTWYTNQPDGLLYYGKIAYIYKGQMPENTEIVIKDGTLGIGDDVFYYCTNLTKITLPDGLKVIGQQAFRNCSKIMSVDIPNSVTDIGRSAFGSCYHLSSLKFGDNITTIGDYAFNSCPFSGPIIIPDKVISIGSGAFSYCRGITSVKIGHSVKTIGRSAFEGCVKLEAISIPNSVTSIASGAFWKCALKSVIIDQKEPLLMDGEDLTDRSNATLYVPEGSAIAYAKADYWKDFKEIKEFPSEQKVGCSVENDNTATVTAASDPTEKEAVIPEIAVIDDEAYPVKAIGVEAFKDNTALSIVCIPKTIEKIGESAFSGCSGLNAIYSYTEDPIALDSKAAVRTRTNSDETSASAVFAEVNKASCILYVPKNCSDKYRAANGWKEFQNIVEMESKKPGDANNDTNVDSKDIDATIDYIMEGKTKDFIFKNADVKVDNKINAADIVKIVNLITDPK